MTAKAREASLTPSEQEDLDEYIQTADILAIVQSKARQAIKRRWRGCSVTVLSHVQVNHRRFNTCETPVRHIFAPPPSAPVRGGRLRLRPPLTFAPGSALPVLVPALSVLVPLLN